MKTFCQIYLWSLIFFLWYAAYLATTINHGFIGLFIFVMSLYYLPVKLNKI